MQAGVDVNAGTLFSGIGAPECSAPGIDWRWSAEIDPFASAVHAARFPNIPNLGDVMEIDADAIEPVDLVVFGSPCQSFSVAGKRLGLDDPRGNLALVALRLIGRIRPKWMVFENVPGLLSSDGGRDFGAFLGLLGELGYGFAYRILDAQYAGVPQRRRRVFVVGCIGDWRGPAAVLFEPESLRGHPAPRREAGKGITPILEAGARTGVSTTDPRAGIGIGEPGEPGDPMFTVQRGKQHAIAFSAKDHGGDAGETAPTLRAGMHGNSHANAGVMPAVAYGLDCENLGDGGNIGWHPAEQPSITLNTNGNIGVAHSLRADGFDASEDGTGRGTPLTLAIRGRGDSHDLECRQDGTANAILTPNGGRAGIGVGAVAIQNATRGKSQNGLGVGGDAMFTLDQASHHAVASAMSVRRLTPRECERLQGFPDDWTLIRLSRAQQRAVDAEMAAYYRRTQPELSDEIIRKLAKDGPRYRALGNSMAVPVIGWVLCRIHQFEGGA
jgi:DNA (cytosine-5)-methyltransferase 1